jgi:uncharacterized membrane protein
MAIVEKNRTTRVAPAASGETMLVIPNAAIAAIAMNRYLFI